MVSAQTFLLLSHNNILQYSSYYYKKIIGRASTADDNLFIKVQITEQ